MNKWIVYWLLHCVGFAGLVATLVALPNGCLPSYVMGSIGGGWMAAFICLARWLVMRRKPHDVVLSGAHAKDSEAS